MHDSRQFNINTKNNMFEIQIFNHFILSDETVELFYRKPLYW